MCVIKLFFFCVADEDTGRKKWADSPKVASLSPKDRAAAMKESIMKEIAARMEKKGEKYKNKPQKNKKKKKKKKTKQNEKHFL